MKTILTLAAAAVAFSAAPAFAQETAAPGQLVVSYADLDLRTDRDIRRLDRRIRTAVEEVCGPESSFDPAGKNRIHWCRIETLAVARAQRDNAIAAAAGSTQVQLASQR